VVPLEKATSELLNKTQIFRKMLRSLNAVSPYFFDRGLTIGTGVAPAVFVREALRHSRGSGQNDTDLDDPLQFLAFAAPLARAHRQNFFKIYGHCGRLGASMTAFSSNSAPRMANQKATLFSSRWR
jgi:hypothetical protein